MTHKNQETSHKKDEKEHKAPVKEADALQKAHDEIAELKDKYIRLYADMENTKRRCQMDMQKTAKTAIGDFAMEVITVEDNLERAMAQEIPPELAENAFIKNVIAGLKITQKTLMDSLHRNGVTPMDVLGKPFDPNAQKAIQEVIDDTKPAGTVLQEWQKGYMIGGDRVLREAIVIVSKKS